MPSDTVEVQRDDLARIIAVAERPGMSRMTSGEGQARDRLKQALAGGGSGGSADLIDVFGVPGETLLEAGYETLAQVRAASDDELLALDGIGSANLRKIRAKQGG